MARRSRSNVQEDTVSTDNAELASQEPGTSLDGDTSVVGVPNEFPNTHDPETGEAFVTDNRDLVEPDLDVETPAEPDADDEVEDIPEQPAAASDDKPKAAKKEKAQPKRGELPDGYVTPIGLTKAINEQGLYRNREGEVAELKPQMVYSYIKNAPKDRPYPGKTVTDSVGSPRENCVLLEEGLAWWNAKNEAADARRKSAAEKAAKAAEAKAKKATAAGDTSTAAGTPDEAGVVEEAE
jgi:hypothetical protein